MEKIWKVVPLCDKQLKDIRESDIIENGIFRKCNTYRGGGGYDKFPKILKKRLKVDIENYEQFIVQLYGCNLKCPYCYVTKDGIFNKYITYSSNELIDIFRKNNLKIFHLMGGNPALYLKNWNKIIENLNIYEEYFTSDILLSEFKYKDEYIKNINFKNCLYAVNIKGTDKYNYEKNTLVKYNENLIFKNLEILVKNNLNFYLTFTNPNLNTLNEFKEKLIFNFGNSILEDFFIINLINYKALENE